MNLNAIESGKSASQIREETLIQMLFSFFLCEIELSALTPVENPKICFYAEYIDLERNLESL